MTTAHGSDLTPIDEHMLALRAQGMSYRSIVIAISHFTGIHFSEPYARARCRQLRPRSRAATAPVPQFEAPTGRTYENHIAPEFLIVAPGPTHIVVLDHDGYHGYGALASHTPDKLRELDTWLDKYDAANEDQHGRLPHEVPAPVALPVRAANGIHVAEAA